MIKASKAGLPVNISKAPIPPQMQAISKNLKPALSPQESLDSSAVIQGYYSMFYLKTNLLKIILLLFFATFCYFHFPLFTFRVFKFSL